MCYGKCHNLKQIHFRMLVMTISIPYSQLVNAALWDLYAWNSGINLAWRIFGNSKKHLQIYTLSPWRFVYTISNSLVDVKPIQYVSKPWLYWRDERFVETLDIAVICQIFSTEAYRAIISDESAFKLCIGIPQWKQDPCERWSTSSTYVQKRRCIHHLDGRLTRSRCKSTTSITSLSFQICRKAFPEDDALLESSKS